uniref:Uncharacterized protein n=1 Tax=Picea sitchensis TaxID=3332 RepID=A9P0X0_PICSI|nr:unknown [Picea sitchensis]
MLENRGPKAQMVRKRLLKRRGREIRNGRYKMSFVILNLRRNLKIAYFGGGRNQVTGIDGGMMTETGKESHTVQGRLTTRMKGTMMGSKRTISLRVLDAKMRENQKINPGLINTKKKGTWMINQGLIGTKMTSKEMKENVIEMSNRKMTSTEKRNIEMTKTKLIRIRRLN